MQSQYLCQLRAEMTGKPLPCPMAVPAPVEPTPSSRVRCSAGIPSTDIVVGIETDSAAESDEPSSDYDFTALDQLMPHPVYGRMYWMCVLNPSDETFATKVHPLLVEAYQLAVSKHKG